MQIRTNSALAIVVAVSAAVVSACSQDGTPALNQVATCGLVSAEQGQFIDVPAGSFIKGTAPIYPEEAPTIRLQVSAFRIQVHEVTNAQFAVFVEQTGYITDAEQSLLDERVDAGSAVFLHPAERREISDVWTLEPRANWRSPNGTDELFEDREDHPVIHVSRRDADAYAEWAGGRLPSEVEWEYAASLGLRDPDDASSGAYDEDRPVANTWQGVFPMADLGTDGFTDTAPVGCFEADRLGLHDMIGNVWEWTSTPFNTGTYTLKGGSYLCANNFCRRYRPAARQPQETDFSTNHIGFRIVQDIDPDTGGE